MSPSPRTTARLVESLPTTLLETVEAGGDREVTAVEFLEPGVPGLAEVGDLLLAVGADGTDGLLAALAHHPQAAGVVVRRSLSTDPALLDHCRAHGTALVALADDATWGAAHTLLRTAAEAAASPGTRDPHDLYADLFDLADRVGAILDAPVTVEDAQSRVLAYSSGQQGADVARTSTIIGRRVPRRVREHFRALGVFRHLATSDEPVLVPAGPDVKARWVLGIRAGGEWLGSVWAVVEDDVPAERLGEVRVAADVLALHLLRLRSQTELHHQVRTEQVRAALRGGDAAEPDGLGPGPHRVVVLGGPRHDLPAEERLAAWTATLRRRGWRHPLLADLDAHVHALVDDRGDAPGSWEWLARLVSTDAARGAGLRAYAGGPADAWDLPRSREQAAELAALSPASPARVDDHWSGLVLGRAGRSLSAGPATLSPVRVLAAHDEQHGGRLVATLAVVLDHWGDPRRAADVLGVHVNTVRNRTERLVALSGLDLGDPRQRQAAWLEVSAAQETKSSHSSDR